MAHRGRVPAAHGACKNQHLSRGASLRRAHASRRRRFPVPSRRARRRCRRERRFLAFLLARVRCVGVCRYGVVLFPGRGRGREGTWKAGIPGIPAQIRPARRGRRAPLPVRVHDRRWMRCEGHEQRRRTRVWETRSCRGNEPSAAREISPPRRFRCSPSFWPRGATGTAVSSRLLRVASVLDVKTFVCDKWTGKEQGGALWGGTRRGF